MGFTLIPDKWFKLRRIGISTSEIVLLGKLYSLSHNGTEMCEASDLWLAESLDLTWRSIQSELKHLEKEKLISRGAARVKGYMKQRCITIHEECINEICEKEYPKILSNVKREEKINSK